MRNKKKRKEKNMKFSRSKTRTIAIALFLMFAMAFSLVAVPVATARDPPIEITTFAFILVSPNPVGVGQKVDVIMWVDKTPGGSGAAAYDNDIRFHDYKLTITKPDGATEVMTWDICQDPTSSQYTSYVPAQTGEYTFKFEYPGQVYTWSGTYQNDTYLGSSATTTLTVQEEEVTAITSYPLPTEYWTRPIYGENTDWWTISSNWLGTGSPEFTVFGFDQNVYASGAVGSKTAHVMWTRPLQSGGVVGDDNFIVPGDTYFEGTAYLQRFTNPIIMAGKLYYTEPLNYGGVGGFSGSASGPTVCVDLRTGELIWSRTDVPSPSFGYIYSYQDMNYHGVQQPTLIATSGGWSWFGPPTPLVWQGYDADTGTWLFNATDVPSGTKAMGPQGEYLQYVMANAGNDTNPDYRLLQWNSSKLGLGGYMMATGAILGVVDASTPNRYDWNVSMPWANTMVAMGPYGLSLDFTVVAAYANDIMLCYNGTLPTGDSPSTFGRPISSAPYTYFAVNLNASKGTVGSVLWRKTYNAPSGGITVFVTGADPTTGVFIETHKETIQWVAYNLRTGEKMWGPTGDQTALDYYGDDFGGVMNGYLAYGNIYYSGMAGIMYCYDALTGELLWTYGNGGEGNSTSSGAQMAYGRYPTMIEAIGDGVVYTSVIEHTVNTPIYKGARTRAVNATDGTEVYTLSDYGSSWTQAIADGFTTFMNGYDNQIYVVGRGPSATTVSASPKVSVHGDSVLVEGMVIDTAAGTAQDEQAARFPNGVPAVSDESIIDWMEYVYQQKPRPADAVGVEVVIEVLDPNNNYYEVGRATSDASGMFHCAFTPEVPGEYSIIATFEGSDGYWPSFAETAINVEEAPAATPAPTPTPASVADMYFLPVSIGMIVAIIIVLALLVLLLLRKR
jgi:outer membrane protein assembly factor BamB